MRSGENEDEPKKGCWNEAAKQEKWKTLDKAHKSSSGGHDMVGLTEETEDLLRCPLKESDKWQTDIFE